MQSADFSSLQIRLSTTQAAINSIDSLRRAKCKMLTSQLQPFRVATFSSKVQLLVLSQCKSILGIICTDGNISIFGVARHSNQICRVRSKLSKINSAEFSAKADLLILNSFNEGSELVSITDKRITQQFNEQTLDFVAFLSDNRLLQVDYNKLRLLQYRDENIITVKQHLRQQIQGDEGQRFSKLIQIGPNRILLFGGNYSEQQKSMSQFSQSRCVCVVLTGDLKQVTQGLQLKEVTLPAMNSKLPYFIREKVNCLDFKVINLRDRLLVLIKYAKNIIQFKKDLLQVIIRKYHFSFNEEIVAACYFPHMFENQAKCKDLQKFDGKVLVYKQRKDGDEQLALFPPSLFLITDKGYFQRVLLLDRSENSYLQKVQPKFMELVKSHWVAPNKQIQMATFEPKPPTKQGKVNIIIMNEEQEPNQSIKEKIKPQILIFNQQHNQSRQVIYQVTQSEQQTQQIFVQLGQSNQQLNYNIKPSDSKKYQDQPQISLQQSARLRTIRQMQSEEQLERSYRMLINCKNQSLYPIKLEGKNEFGVPLFSSSQLQIKQVSRQKARGGKKIVQNKVSLMDKLLKQNPQIRKIVLQSNGSSKLAIQYKHQILEKQRLKLWDIEYDQFSNVSKSQKQNCSRGHGQDSLIMQNQLLNNQKGGKSQIIMSMQPIRINIDNKQKEITQKQIQLSQPCPQNKKPLQLDYTLNATQNIIASQLAKNKLTTTSLQQKKEEQNCFASAVPKKEESAPIIIGLTNINIFSGNLTKSNQNPISSFQLKVSDPLKQKQQASGLSNIFSKIPSTTSSSFFQVKTQQKPSTIFSGFKGPSFLAKPQQKPSTIFSGFSGPSFLAKTQQKHGTTISGLSGMSLVPKPQQKPGTAFSGFSGLMLKPQQKHGTIFSGFSGIMPKPQQKPGTTFSGFSGLMPKPQQKPGTTFSGFSGLMLKPQQKHGTIFSGFKSVKIEEKKSDVGFPSKGLLGIVNKNSLSYQQKSSIFGMTLAGSQVSSKQNVQDKIIKDSTDHGNQYQNRSKVIKQRLQTLQFRLKGTNYFTYTTKQFNLRNLQKIISAARKYIIQKPIPWLQTQIQVERFIQSYTEPDSNYRLLLHYFKFSPQLQCLKEKIDELSIRINKAVQSVQNSKFEVKQILNGVREKCTSIKSKAYTSRGRFQFTSSYTPRNMERYFSFKKVHTVAISAKIIKLNESGGYTFKPKPKIPKKKELQPLIIKLSQSVEPPQMQPTAITLSRKISKRQPFNNTKSTSLILQKTKINDLKTNEAAVKSQNATVQVSITKQQKQPVGTNIVGPNVSTSIPKQTKPAAEQIVSQTLNLASPKQLEQTIQLGKISLTDSKVSETNIAAKNTSSQPPSSSQPTFSAVAQNTGQSNLLIPPKTDSQINLNIINISGSQSKTQAVPQQKTKQKPEIPIANASNKPAPQSKLQQKVNVPNKPTAQIKLQQKVKAPIKPAPQINPIPQVKKESKSIASQQSKKPQPEEHVFQGKNPQFMKTTVQKGPQVKKNIFGTPIVTEPQPSPIFKGPSPSPSLFPSSFTSSTQPPTTTLPTSVSPSPSPSLASTSGTSSIFNKGTSPSFPSAFNTLFGGTGMFSNAASKPTTSTTSPIQISFGSSIQTNQNPWASLAQNNQTSIFGTQSHPPQQMFGQTPTAPPFGQSPTASPFGQSPTAPSFGQPPPFGYVQPSGMMQSPFQAQSGQPLSIFGQTQPLGPTQPFGQFPGAQQGQPQVNKDMMKARK